jgi:hypothetical protein
VPSDFAESEIQTETHHERIEHDAAAEEAKADAGDRQKDQSKKADKKFQVNKDNPIFLGNAIAIVGLSGMLGYGAYRKHAAGQLTWKVVGLWTGIVGAFAIGDYYLSQYVLFHVILLDFCFEPFPTEKHISTHLPKLTKYAGTCSRSILRNRPWRIIRGRFECPGWLGDLCGVISSL